MPENPYYPFEYLAGIWQILDQSGFEEIFPDEFTAWVCKPDGTIHVYRSKTHRAMPQTSQAWMTYRIICKKEDLNPDGFITVYLDGLFRLPQEEETKIRLYHAGYFLFMCRFSRVALVRLS